MERSVCCARLRVLECGYDLTLAQKSNKVESGPIHRTCMQVIPTSDNIGDKRRFLVAALLRDHA
ncbi:uncharacterized protein EI90DRAFT_3029299 [Cantharellus anzutake]|uniref:uncharacterized protein n=1 Tax=Cantharellus anzutake TaxID=1750568 RepID=UPI001906FF49|nr:uncharacterized protein EI90DRAFT_3029299 [Cantharellus anzutake]KAF8344327.1 hypothetical protein EI90DRAFT_3029299 [Cantharellus anzutake]